MLRRYVLFDVIEHIHKLFRLYSVVSLSLTSIRHGTRGISPPVITFTTLWVWHDIAYLQGDLQNQCSGF
jgi:hypothetical protein